MPPSLPAGLFVTDPARTPDILETVERLPDGFGVLFRHFGLADQIKLAPSLARLCHSQSRLLLVSADPRLARHIDATGVHWPTRLASEASRITPSQKPGIQTMSAHSIKELRHARSLGMDAILVSSVFESASPSAGAPMGLARLAAFARNTNLGVYALGGIVAENAERVSNLAGLASSSGLSRVYRPRP